MTNKNLKAVVIFALASAAASAQAQTFIRPAYQFPGDAPATGGTELGGSGLFLTDYLGLAAGHDSNMFLSSANQKASNLYVVSPGFKIDGRRPGLVLLSSYQAQVGRYTSSQADNYADQVFHNQVDAAFNQRTFLRVGYDFIRGHDPRGSTDRPLEGRPDVYRLSTPSATFAFGAPGAPGRIELYYSDAHRGYLNNQPVTHFSDRDTTEGGAAFYWRVAPKTYVLFEAREDKIDYDTPNPLSAKEHRYYIGATWEATAATTGTIKIGQLKRDFDGPIPSTSTSSWEGTITWAPRSYSKFDFYTARQTNESTGLGTFILSSIGGVNWTHAWTSYLDTGVNLRYQRDQYQGFDRTDNTKGLGLKVGYRFRPWLTLGAEYNYTKRDSNIGIFDYDRNLYLLTATAAM